GVGEQLVQRGSGQLRGGEDACVPGESAAEVSISASEIGNSVSLRKGVDVDIDSSDITGDLQLEENVGAVNVRDNTIVGSIQANKNRGGTTITLNRLGNGLQCQDNNPAPVGGGNIAKQKQGQCEHL
ncbi:MAG: hypothetical protein M3Q22_11065, partial [Actinomycetota bacterium]|nr:hypothetical protein [Actinomycetota bacterium]